MSDRYLTRSTKMTNAGKFTHQIIIRNPQTSRDSFGGTIGTGSVVDTIYAEKQDWAGQEARENGSDTATVRTKFVIRYHAAIRPKMQVVHGSNVYDIESVLDFDGSQRELVLECKRVTS